MLQRPTAPRKRAPSAVAGASISATEVGKQIDEFNKQTDLYYEVSVLPDGTKQLAPKSGTSKNGAGANEQDIMKMYGWYWEPLLHDLAFLEQMRDNIPLIAGVYQKFTDLVMEGFSLQVESDGDDAPSAPGVQTPSDEITDLLINDPAVDFQEVVRSAVLQLATTANCYFIPIYTADDRGFRVSTFKPVRSTAMRKLRDANLVTQGYVQLLRRPGEFWFGGNKANDMPVVWLANEVLCGTSYIDGWYPYGKPPLAALPVVAKMKLQIERDLVEMLHQHVPRIDITYTPDTQMNEDQVQDAMDRAKAQIAALKPTDNYLHTPDFEFEYKGPGGSGLDFSDPMRYIGEQLYAVLPLLSGYLSSDLNVNPMIATQSFRITCSLANYLRSRIKVMFSPVLKRLADERDLGKITINFADLDAETAETTARTNEYNTNNAATARDAGFVDQDTAAGHATSKTPGGPVRKAAEPGAIPPPVDPNKAAPGGPNANNGDGKKPPSKGGRARTPNRAKGPKPANRSAPTPDKRTKGRKHEALSLDDEVAGLREVLSQDP